MAKGSVEFKKKSKYLRKTCFFCGKTALWEAHGKNGEILCCGSKHCQKKAEKYVD